MTFELALFYFFSGIALFSAIMVISARNPVHSVLFLILVFCNSAGLLILLEAEFLALLFIVVYVGAIAVLFLFVVMMLNVKISEVQDEVLQYLPIGGLIGIVFLLEIFLIIFVGKNIVLKRGRPRARGRFGKILKPFSELTIKVRQIPSAEENS